MTEWNHAGSDSGMQPMNGRTIFAVHESSQWATLRRQLAERYYLQCVDLPKLWLLAIEQVQATAHLVSTSTLNAWFGESGNAKINLHTLRTSQVPLIVIRDEAIEPHLNPVLDVAAAILTTPVDAMRVATTIGTLCASLAPFDEYPTESMQPERRLEKRMPITFPGRIHAGARILKSTFKDLSRGGTLIELDSQAHAIETSEVTLEFETAWGIFHSNAQVVDGDPVRKRYHLKFENTPENADRVLRLWFRNTKSRTDTKLS